jgi:hypothetical protein
MNRTCSSIANTQNNTYLKVCQKSTFEWRHNIKPMALEFVPYPTAVLLATARQANVTFIGFNPCACWRACAFVQHTHIICADDRSRRPPIYWPGIDSVFQARREVLQLGCRVGSTLVAPVVTSHEHTARLTQFRSCGCSRSRSKPVSFRNKLSVSISTAYPSRNSSIRGYATVTSWPQAGVVVGLTSDVRTAGS